MFELKSYHSDLAIIALTALCIAATAWEALHPGMLAFERVKINEGQWWRIITGQLVHNNAVHALLNITGLWSLYLIAKKYRVDTGVILGLPGILILTGYSLYALAPELLYYVGLSGAVHGALTILALSLILTQERLAGALLLALIICKLLSELNPNCDDAITAQMIGMPIATNSHALGAGAGFLLFAAWCVTRARALRRSNLRKRPVKN